VFGELKNHGSVVWYVPQSLQLLAKNETEQTKSKNYRELVFLGTIYIYKNTIIQGLTNTNYQN